LCAGQAPAKRGTIALPWATDNCGRPDRAAHSAIMAHCDDLRRVALEPFYLLVFLAGLLLASLILALLRATGSRLRGAPFERRTLLSPDELTYLKAIELAAGPDCRVLPKVAAASLLRPERGLRLGQRRLARRALAEGRVDLVVAAAADVYPLCIVRFADPARPRPERRSLARIAAGCSNAGMPVIELPLDQTVDAQALQQLVQDAIDMAGVRLSKALEPPPEEEEALLAELAAAMRDPEELTGPRR